MRHLRRYSMVSLTTGHRHFIVLCSHRRSTFSDHSYRQERTAPIASCLRLFFLISIRWLALSMLASPRTSRRTNPPRRLLPPIPFFPCFLPSLHPAAALFPLLFLSIASTSHAQARLTATTQLQRPTNREHTFPTNPTVPYYGRRSKRRPDADAVGSSPRA